MILMFPEVQISHENLCGKDSLRYLEADTLKHSRKVRMEEL